MAIEARSRECYFSFVGYAKGQLSKMGKFERRGFRGEKRKELIDRYGYDTKNAAHCIRLMRMLIEVLQTGQFFVDRSEIDASELLAIKKGAWSQDRVISEAQTMFRKAEELYKTCTLPNAVDLQKVDDLLVRLFSGKWGLND